MENPIKIPADVGQHLLRVEQAMQGTVARLEELHKLWGEDEEDREYPDGTIDEWHVQMRHSEAERLMENLRKVADLAGWLAKFSQGEEAA